MAKISEVEKFRKLIHRGFYRDALSISNKQLKRKNLTENNYVTYKTNEIKILLYQGKNKKALQETDVLIDRLTKIKAKISHLKIFDLLGEVFLRTGDLQRGQHYVEQGEELYKLEFEQSNKHPNCYASLLLQKGSIYNLMEKKKDSIKYLNKSLSLSEELDNDSIRILCINQLGIYYGRLGDLFKSKNYFEDGLSLSEKSEYKFGLLLCKSNLGYIHFVLGNINLAEKLTEECISLFLDSENIPSAATAYINLGNINRAADRFIDSYYYYNKSLQLRKSLKNELYVAESLYHLIILTVENQMETYAKANLEQLSLINDRTKITFIEQYYHLAQGYVKKTVGTIKEKKEAIRNFDIIINQKIIDNELTVFALLNKFDILLEDLSLSKSDEIFPKLADLSKKLTDIANDNNSSSLFAETYILKSRLALIEGNHSYAEELLYEAKSKIKDKNHDKLNKQISLEIELLNKHKIQISDSEKTDTADLDDFIGKMSKRQTFITKESQGELIDYLNDLNHDVNNHLNTIIMFCELMIMDNKINMEFLEKIIKKSKQTSSLFKQGLRYIEAGELLNLENGIDLNLIVEMVRELIVPRKVNFVKTDLPKVNCDREKIKQLFSNLFENAIIHGNPKSLKVESKEAKTHWNIKISNDGAIIPKNLRNKIFDRGFSTRKGNMGLGTSIMLKISESHGWNLTLEDNNLTTFVISIPK